MFMLTNNAIPLILHCFLAIIILISFSGVAEQWLFLAVRQLLWVMDTNIGHNSENDRTNLVPHE